MELEGNIPSMVQESVPPSGASIDTASAPMGSCSGELQSSASSSSLSLQVGYTRNFAEVCTVKHQYIPTPINFVVNTLKLKLKGSIIKMPPKDADCTANIVDPDQNAPLGAV